MSPTAIALVVFVGALGGALLGMWLGGILPEKYLGERSRDAVKNGAGVVATMAALVLGLLVSSADGSLDRIGDDLLRIAGKVVLLDRALAEYGPEASPVRASIKQIYATELTQLLSGNEAEQVKLTTLESAASSEAIPVALRALAPATEAQSELKSHALEIAGDVATERWLLLFQRWNTIPVPLLVALVAWLASIFAFFGLFAPRNPVVLVVFIVCAASAASAIFLIQEMNTPFSGWITVSLGPLEQALSHLGE